MKKILTNLFLPLFLVLLLASTALSDNSAWAHHKDNLIQLQALWDSIDWAGVRSDIKTGLIYIGLFMAFCYLIVLPVLVAIRAYYDRKRRLEKERAEAQQQKNDFQ